MADIYIRNIDAATKAKLKECAKLKGMSLNQYVINILMAQGENINIKSSAAKYESLVKNVVSIYQERVDELVGVINRNNYLIEKLTEKERIR